MEIVVNEWLLEYMRPDSGNVQLAWRFLDVLERKCDKIVVRRISSFTQKLYRYNASFPRYFGRLILLLYNSDKVRLVDEAEIQVKEIPEEVLKIVPPDDIYLVELAWSESDRPIVTTDKRLKDKLRQKWRQEWPPINIELVEEFLPKYLGTSR